ncbi:tyrosine-type recombinase/integrase [Haloferax prahovense]|uniref:tyrosine-type recombinase/integrase n=1 Tax=Haloferax prahovense TaxID=381852 RepID=UPI003C71C534
MGNLNKTSLKTQLSTVRAFVKFLETIDAVPTDLHRDVILPSLKHGEDVRDVAVSEEESEAIQDYLTKFEYATFRHALFALLWETAIRTGTAHSLDVGDVLFEERALRIRHRPDTGTRLKNGVRAERLVALSEELCTVLEDYIRFNRPNTTDEYGRNPLFASQHGRMHKSNLRNAIYALTRPCHYSGECPHDREQTAQDCEAIAYEKAAKCPSSVSLHAIRRGGITWRLLEDVPKTVISDRADVSPDILDKHYDVRSEKSRMEQRRSILGLGGGDD